MAARQFWTPLSKCLAGWPRMRVTTGEIERNFQWPLRSMSASQRQSDIEDRTRRSSASFSWT